jgi:hypothetical protein
VVSGSTRAAADIRRGEGAHATLATVLGYVQARADAITTLLTAVGR